MDAAHCLQPQGGQAAAECSLMDTLVASPGSLGAAGGCVWGGGAESEVADSIPTKAAVNSLLDSASLLQEPGWYLCFHSML